MRWKHSQQNTVVYAVLDEGRRQVIAMAVDNK
jgi:hypothetical protein